MSTVKALKLSTNEQEKVKEVTLQLNRKLLGHNIMAMKESEILHALISLALPKLNVNREGRLGFYPEEQGEIPFELERRSAQR